MKMRLRLILCGLLLGVYPLSGFAESVLELIEKFPTGQINWTQGVVIAKGSGTGPLESNPHSRAEAIDQAISNIQATLSRLRMDGRTCVADVMAKETRTREEVADMAAGAEIIRTAHRSDGGVEITVKMVLSGGFAQLMLPEEIRQVEPIRPLKGSGAHGTSDAGLSVGAAAQDANEPDAFTGLIVDARGIGAQASMVPMLFDENGQEVYSPAFVSREYAVQYGICQYQRFVGDASRISRVAPRPLMVKGLCTRDNVNSEIVISNADAAKLRSSSAHLGFLKQCRVIILMD